MVYEAEIPPIPTRAEELEMINKLEQNFISQPWYKFYMNEHLRTTKMEVYSEQNEVKRQMRRNFAAGAIIFGAMLLPLTLFYHRRACGVPAYFVPKMYDVSLNKQHVHQYRNIQSLKLIIPIWFGLSFAAAIRYTDFSYFMDENMAYGKAKLPY